jgi:5-dehydro-2-deoxygluconokinase
MKFSSETKFDVLCMGRSTCDVYSVEIGDLKDSKTFARYLGGSPANTAAALSKLGLKVGFIGKVSDDGMGEFVRERLQAFCIDTSHLETDKEGHLTGITIGEIKGDGKCSCLMYRNDCADLHLKPEEIDADYIKQSKALLVSGISLSRSPAREAVFKAITVAKTNGVKVIFDPDYRDGTFENREQAAAYLSLGASQADLVIGTQDEFAIVAAGLMPGQAYDDKAFAAALLERDPEIVVIKAGSSGSTAYTADGSVPAPAFHEKKILKTFGAGDSFAGAFIHALISGCDLKEAQRQGAAGAALTIKGHSCSDASPDLKTLQDFLKTH